MNNKDITKTHSSTLNPKTKNMNNLLNPIMFKKVNIELMNMHTERREHKEIEKEKRIEVRDYNPRIMIMDVVAISRIYSSYMLQNFQILNPEAYEYLKMKYSIPYAKKTLFEHLDRVFERVNFDGNWYVYFDSNAIYSSIKLHFV